MCEARDRGFEWPRFLHLASVGASSFSVFTPVINFASIGLEKGEAKVGENFQVAEEYNLKDHLVEIWHVRVCFGNVLPFIV